MEDTELQRDQVLGEMGAVRSTVHEQINRQVERLRHKNQNALAAAGDLDRAGEESLRMKFRQVMEQKQRMFEVCSPTASSPSKVRMCVVDRTKWRLFFVNTKLRQSCAA